MRCLGRNISALSRASHLHLIMGNFCGRSIRQAADLILCHLAEMSYVVNGCSRLLQGTCAGDR